MNPIFSLNDHVNWVILKNDGTAGGGNIGTASAVIRPPNTNPNPITNFNPILTTGWRAIRRDSCTLA